MGLRIQTTWMAKAYDQPRFVVSRFGGFSVCLDGGVDDALDVLFGHAVGAKSVHDVADVFRTGPEALPAVVWLHKKRDHRILERSTLPTRQRDRSEERRVGNECGAGW